MCEAPVLVHRTSETYMSASDSGVLMYKRRLLCSNTPHCNNKKQIQDQYAHSSSVSSKNLVAYTRINEGDDCIELLRPYVSGTTIDQYLAAYNQVTLELAHSLCLQITEAVCKCHTSNVSLYTLHHSNIIVENEKAFVVDFGVKSLLCDRHTSRTSSETIIYLGPEGISSLECDDKQHDMWCLGLICYLVFCGKYPWQIHNMMKLCRQMVNGEIDFPSGIPIDIQNFLQRILCSNPSKRPTAVDAFLELSNISVPKDTLAPYNDSYHIPVSHSMRHVAPRLILGKRTTVNLPAFSTSNNVFSSLSKSGSIDDVASRYHTGTPRMLPCRERHKNPSISQSQVYAIPPTNSLLVQNSFLYDE